MSVKEISSENIGAKLKNLIKDKFDTQEQFAKACNKSVRQVRRWTNDGVSDIDTVAMLAELLEEDLWALLA